MSPRSSGRPENSQSRFIRPSNRTPVGQSPMRSSSTFVQRVKDIVKNIPPGSTMTYADVARLAGSPKAARAVGSIMAGNYDEQIPCHRVVRSDGKVGQYNRGGPRAKEALLNQEKTQRPTF